jgi:4-amino-4-deoxy-L-arabinose transferase-like glycosyltransferase
MNRKQKIEHSRKHVAREASTVKSSPGFPSHFISGAILTILVFILAAIPFAYGKYFELNYPDPYDSAAYVYSAQHLFLGAKLGVEETPSAQPGTLLINMLGVKLFGFSEFGPKLIQGILQAAALVLMFYTMRKLYGTLAAAVGVIIASLYLSAPLIAKFGNVKEQHMIAFMVIGVCCYVLGQLGGKWWLNIIAGAALGWAPMFKQTGISAIAAVGLFVIVQPFFKWQSIKQTLVDIGLLAGGFVIGVGPVCLWILSNHYLAYLPYLWAWTMVFGSGSAGSKVGSYVSAARDVVPFKQQFPQVMRYYGCLILPVALALISFLIWAVKQIINLKSKISNLKSRQAAPVYEKFVLLFGLWWILDMAFVWISPRGYEQYYLPLNASAAMTGGYLIALYQDKVRASNYYPGWIVAGLAGMVVMIAMSWQIVFGITVSPFSGKPYGEHVRGYVQKWPEVRQLVNGEKMIWQVVGDYIREHSRPDDGMYVWGWFPGIYIRAERFCPSPAAFESSMHTKAPQTLAEDMNNLLVSFKKKKPVFIVDSRKQEFPNDRPPLPLWPVRITNTGKIELVQDNDEEIDRFDAQYAQVLAESFKDGEADRYKAMKPMRDFIRRNYKIINKGQYGQFILFELKDRS